LEIALGVEEKMGRVREKKWGPRLIDIDLLEFNRTTIDHERLQLPHPFYPKRVFVLAPLAELESEWIPTGHQQTVSELLAAADTQGLSRWQAPNP
jgi:2-amino-4-hydroxy-6-hydroxymethyldihydropteridine diphosphokinase